jgi:hypothetical protein
MKRLENEDFEAYKKRRKNENEKLKASRLGWLVWYSKKLGTYIRKTNSRTGLAA